MSEVGQTGQHAPETADVFATIRSALEGGATLLTPTVRAARFWLKKYDTAARQQGDRSWRTPKVFSWQAWTMSLWQTAVVQGADTRILLNPLQEHCLWRAVIENTSRLTLQSVDSQAELCRGAMRLLGGYDLDARFLRAGSTGAYTSDTRTFADWAEAFQAHCEREGYLPASHLEQELAALLRSGRIPAAGEYILYGLEASTPAAESLLEALQLAGGIVRRVHPETSRQTPPVLLRCDGAQQELQQCAAWVRRQRERHPERSVTVVVPDLPATRPELERELRAAVAPETADVTQPESSAAFEFSSGRVLRHLPMIRDALHLLRWCAQDLSLDAAGTVLRSPHLSLAESPEVGAALDLQVLRQLPALRRTVSLGRAAAALAHSSAGARLGALERKARACRGVENTYAWFADAARDLLASAGFPGAAGLNSEEFQAVDRWNEVLDYLSSLDLFGRRTHLDAFLAELERVAEDALFAPENVGAPVQVVSVPEAAGTLTGALWFLHADAATWPARETPHPMLPWRLQRDLRMPGTDITRDEDAARATLDGLLRSSDAAYFSYNGAAESAPGPAPTIEFAVQEHGGTPLSAEPEEEAVAPADLLRMEPDGAALPPVAAGHVIGGVAVLTAQAQCGFRAFAEKRLFASPLEQLDAGLSQGDRGEQVHAVLQEFWTTVQSQQRLLEMGRELGMDGVSARDTLLRACIDRVLGPAPGDAWDGAYIHVQRRRLFRLLSDWLDFEATRPAFEVVHTEKEIKQAGVGPLQLDMRVDRVDRVTSAEGGGTLLIDYKTGAAFAREWMGERPDQPQLPAYAVAGAVAAGIEQVDGLAFGAVKVGSQGMRLEGMAADPSLLGPKYRKGVPFQDQVEVWREDITRLAVAFAEGDASVNPKEYPKTCDRCSQRMLCRVDAATLLQMDEMEREEEEDEAALWS